MLRASSQLAKKRFSSYLIRNGTVVTASHAKQADVLLRDGVVAEIGAPGQLDSQSGQRIEAGGKLVIPGGIDTHTHMQMPFMGTHSYDDFESGSLSCLAGGTTSFLDFVIPGKGQSILKAYETWRGWADPKVHCDYSLHCALTHWSPDVHREMADLVRLGVQSFKFFMAYKGALMLEEEHVLKAFERAKELGAICLVHAENGELIEHRTRKVLEAGVTGPEGHYLSRPPYIEADAVARVIAIAQTVNNPLYVVHVMSKEAAEAVSRAKQKGLVLYAETLAAALGTDGANLWHKDWDVASRYVMSPPLGPDRTVKKYLMQMLQAGVLEVVGTDNCTFCTSQKRMGLQDFSKIPNGVNGLEDRLSVVWTRGVATGLLSPSQFVEAVATKAAKIFNMYPKKGEIAIGSDADIVVWDHNAKRTISCKTHHQKVDFNVF